MGLTCSRKDEVEVSSSVSLTDYDATSHKPATMFVLTSFRMFVCRPITLERVEMHARARTLAHTNRHRTECKRMLPKTKVNGGGEIEENAMRGKTR